MACSYLVIEVGYMFSKPMGFIVVGLCEDFRDIIKIIFSAVLGELVLGICYLVYMLNNGMHGNITIVINVPYIFKAFIQQVSSAFPWNALFMH